MSETLIQLLLVTLGSLITLLGQTAQARLNKKWEKGKKDIYSLADQVSAYYQLEQLYIGRVAELENKPAKTIQIEMRRSVEQLDGGYKYPKMTSKQARDIREQWE